MTDVVERIQLKLYAECIYVCCWCLRYSVLNPLHPSINPIPSEAAHWGQSPISVVTPRYTRPCIYICNLVYTLYLYFLLAFFHFHFQSLHFTADPHASLSALFTLSPFTPLFPFPPPSSSSCPHRPPADTYTKRDICDTIFMYLLLLYEITIKLRLDGLIF